MAPTTVDKLSLAERDATKLLARAHSLMQRLEGSVVDSFRFGRGQNMYGCFYKVSALEQVLALVDDAAALDDLDGACEYTKAGILNWAGRFQLAAEIYSRLVESRPVYAQSSRTMLALALCHLGQFEEAQRVIDAHNAIVDASPSPRRPLLDFARLGFQEQ